eukprot:8247924-Alexandrium_andersonii.AAC.1
MLSAAALALEAATAWLALAESLRLFCRCQPSYVLSSALLAARGLWGASARARVVCLPTACAHAPILKTLAPRP